VRVAAGDVNGDGHAEIVAASGPGMGAEVQIVDAVSGTVLRTLHPYNGFPNGAFVAAGDVTGDGFADIVTGSGEGGGPHVLVYDGVTGAAVQSFYAFDPTFAGGVRVAVGDVTGDRHGEIIAGSGPGMHATVRVFDGATGAIVSETQPYGAFANSVFVATRAPVNRMALDLPAVASTVSGPFAVGGWALIDDPVTTGIAAIHVWAVPVTGGVPTFLGVATTGDTRPDVAALFGAQYTHAGYYLIAPALPPGVYDIAVSAQSSVTGTFEVMRVVRVTIVP
jgi:hypothetical protein